MYLPEKDVILNEVLAAYVFPATLVGAIRYGQGYINDTFCVLCQPQEGDCIRFILQGLSTAAFPPSGRTDGEPCGHYLLPTQQGDRGRR